MAGITFGNLNFNYKQYDTAPDPITVDFSDLAGETISFGNVPNYIEIDDFDFSENSGSYNVDFFIQTPAANNLTPGTYNARIDVFSEYTSNGSPGYDLEGVVNIELIITETVILQIAPEVVSFNYTSGGSNPTGKIVQVISENPWTLTASNAWITTSVASGTNNGSFTINVDPTGLTDATNLGTVTVNDGTTNKVVDVSLLISDGNTATDYLYVAPSEIDFVKNKSSSYNPTKTISLNASDVWSAVASQSWVVLSQSSGSAGTDAIIVSLDVTALEVGTYAAEITITSGTRLRKTFVSLSLTESTSSLPESGNLYFSDDDIQIQLNSENENAVLEVDFNLTTDDTSINYQKKAPFFKSKASVNVGEECINFISTATFDVPLISKIVNLLNPAIINFTAYEKNFFNSNVVVNFSRTNLTFLNGKTPAIENKLCYIPEEITITKKGAIALHIYKTIAPADVTISGSISKTISFLETSESNIYSAFINLKEYNVNNLDTLTVNFDDIEITVRIKEEQAESVLLCFENEWQLPEIIELNGGLEIKGDTDYSTQKLQVTKTIQEKIYQTKVSETFSIYTGYIESAEEVEWLDKIRSSKKMYLIINDEKIEVIPTFKSLDLYKTRAHQKNFKLTFTKAIV